MLVCRYGCSVDLGLEQDKTQDANYVGIVAPSTVVVMIYVDVGFC